MNANIAMVAGFSLHPDAEEARRRGMDGFAFFRYAINALVANDTKPGRSRLWEEYEELRSRDLRPSDLASRIHSESTLARLKRMAGSL